MREKSFREDLFYRLNAATLAVPPLRERKKDIPLLVSHFLQEFQSGISQKPKVVSDRVMQVLLDYDWPGNIRELKNTLHYVAAIALGECIDPSDLPPGFVEYQPKESTDNIREKMEKELILSTLRKSGNNKKRTAELLKISRKTLYNKLEKYEISTS
jgi:transcriptional regulator with PAS, ATPase and Fis domain